MPVVNILNTGDAVHMFTDGGAFAQDGTLADIINKAHHLPHLHAVITSRGSYWFMNRMVSAIIERFTGFEELVSGISTLFREQYERHADTIAESEISFEIWICGWSSERNRPESYGLRSHGLTHAVHGVDAAPWMLASVHNMNLPWDWDCATRLAGQPIETVEDCGVAIAESQRQFRGVSPNGIEVTGIAGFIQQSTVTRDGVASKILKRWPDKVGELVSP